MISKALVVGAYHKKISELANLGVEVHLLIPSTWGSQVPEITKADGYAIYTLPILFSGKNHFHFYKDMLSVVEAVRPELLHIDEEPYSAVTFQAMRLAKKKKIAALFFSWQNVYKRYPFPFSAIERYNYEAARVAIAGNLEAKEVLRKKGFAKNIFVVPQFGVDPELYAKRAESRIKIKEQLFQSAQVQVIGFIGRLVEEKGILTLIEAASKLPESCRLLLVGSGPLEKKILAMIESLGLSQRVVLVKNVPSEQVPHYLNGLDCLVLPSLTRPNWKEQFGRVLIEAMACEVPVIGSDSGEIPNVIGDAGLLFKEGDVAGLQEKIWSMISDNHLQSKYRKRGLARVLGNFTQKHIALQTLNVYREALGWRSA
jgi:glycosyltransferase involved in cell wall biosynthesis